MEDKRKTLLYCHGCDTSFTVEFDYSLNGNHEVKCPNCGHIHYRVIENGEVTGDRYRSSMQMYTYPASTTSWSGGSNYWQQAYATTGSMPRNPTGTVTWNGSITAQWTTY